MIQSETLDLLEWPRLCQQVAEFTETPLGSLYAQNLPIPATLAESQEQLRQTQEVERLSHSLNPNWKFTGVADCRQSLERAAKGGMLAGAELLDLAQTLAGARRLRRVIEEQEETPTLLALVADLRTYPDLEQEIHHCLGEDAQVADRASAKLGELRGQSRRLREQIYQKLQTIIQRQGNALQETVITQRGDRYVLAVKASHKEQIPGVVQDSSSTGATLYIEPKGTLDLGNQLRQSRRQEIREEEIILRALSQKVGERREDLDDLLTVVTQLDLANACLRYSLWLGANPPRFISPQEAITLRQLRHPLLVWQNRRQDGAEVVPISLTIDPQIRVVTLTGPNTGGKTATLKTLGLAALMAKAGLYLPAKEPVEIPWFAEILADIGDEQSLEQSLSTFSGHIRRIGRILDALPPADPYASALVLLDEVGAGTDPVEGTALAIALLNDLAQKTQLTLATTHYGELKSLKYQDARFENASVEFDDQTLAPTYRLLWGIPGRSNALAIAQRLGLPQGILEQARVRLGGLREDVNQVIAGLEEQRREQESKAGEARRLLQETEAFHRELLAKSESLQRRERELKQQQEEEVQRAILEAKAEIAQVIRQLQRGTPTAQDAHQATQALAQIQHSQKPAPVPQGYLPQIGERVRLANLGQTAEVTSLESGEVTVKLGLLKMTLPLADIESLDGKKAEPPPPKPAPMAPLPQTPKAPIRLRSEKNTIDLRGSRVEAAESLLEEAIRQANDFGALWIIHGKGTGKLREGVREFLDRHPQVSRYETAPREEGGAGVTVAFLS
ncbi:MAG: endonuclease MutS2 [Cyanobacteriota bacterium]